MCVRLKLDQCGIKLSLKQWNKFPSAERHQLASMPCESASSSDPFRAYLVALIKKWTSSEAEDAPLDSSPAWMDAKDTPARVVAYALNLGMTAPTSTQWASLLPLQRFALFKLTRPGHDNDNFIPAMREFGLLG
jgi:hypothetical protein